MTGQMKLSLEKAQREAFDKFPTSVIESKVDPEKAIYAVPMILWDEAIKAVYDNLWHDASEDWAGPKRLGDHHVIVGICDYKNHVSVITFENFYTRKYVEEQWPNLKIWAYLEDLLPSDLNKED